MDWLFVETAIALSGEKDSLIIRSDSRMTLVAENVSPDDGIVTPFVMLESHGDIYSTQG